MIKKMPSDGFFLGATACLIGLAIFIELQELNYHARKNRIIIVKPEPEDGPVIDIAFQEASDVVIQQAEEVVKRVRRKRERGPKSEPEPTIDPDSNPAISGNEIN